MSGPLYRRFYLCSPIINNMATSLKLVKETHTPLWWLHRHWLVKYRPCPAAQARQKVGVGEVGGGGYIGYSFHLHLETDNYMVMFWAFTPTIPLSFIRCWHPKGLSQRCFQVNCMHWVVCIPEAFAWESNTHTTRLSCPSLIVLEGWNKY